LEEKMYICSGKRAAKRRDDVITLLRDNEKEKRPENRMTKGGQRT